jgi:hypothetical protein
MKPEAVKSYATTVETLEQKVREQQQGAETKLSQFVSAIPPSDRQAILKQVKGDDDSQQRQSFVRGDDGRLFLDVPPHPISLKPQTAANDKLAAAGRETPKAIEVGKAKDSDEVQTRTDESGKKVVDFHVTRDQGGKQIVKITAEQPDGSVNYFQRTPQGKWMHVDEKQKVLGPAIVPISAKGEIGEVRW